MADQDGTVETRVEPLQSEKLRIACAFGVFIIALLLYWATLAPAVTLVDSGELIVAARSLGVAHPPGFPLYVLLAHLATLIPAGDVAVRVNFFSALCAALASGMLTLVVFEAMLCAQARAASLSIGQPPKRGRFASKQKASSETIVASGSITIGAAISAGLLMACSRTLWAYGTIAEVYALNSFLSLSIFFLMLRWRRRIIDERGRTRGKLLPRYDRLLYGAAFVFGLALGVHHVTIGLCLPGYAALVHGTEGLSFYKSKRLLWAALAAFAGLAVYAYLPLSASHSPLLNWGDPSTLQRLYWHVTGKQYGVFFDPSIDLAISQFGGFARMTMREFGPWWAPLGLLAGAGGFISLFKKDRTLFFFLLLVVLADLGYSLNYEIAEDKDAYYLPVFTSIVIAASFGVQWLIRSVQTPARKPRMLKTAAAVILAAMPLTALAANLRYNNRRQYFIAHDYADNILGSIEPNGMLLTLDWQVYSPMLYVREVERRRRDVISIDVSLLRRSWYYAYLEREYPDLINGASSQVEAFLEDLLHWDQDPAAYQSNQDLNARINSRFLAMIAAFVETRIRVAPVYFTQEIPTGGDSTDGQLAKALSAKYQFVPNGLVFRACGGREFHEPASPELITRGLIGGSLKFEDDDPVKLKVLPVYINMFANKGRYLAAFNRNPQALEAFDAVLNFDPDNKAAKQMVERIQEAIRKEGSKRE